MEPTCTEAGLKSKYCSRCKQWVDTQTIDALGHDYKVTSDHAATCTEKGLKIETCSRCSDQKRTETDALGHVDANKDDKCDRCGASLKTEPEDPCANGHDIEKKVIEPTCTEKGKTVITCKRCSYKAEENETPALGHHMVTEEAVEATCEHEGKTEKKYCDRCNLVVEESKKIAKKDHEGVAENPVAATCVKEGSTGRIVCKWCGKELQPATVTPKTGHDYEVKVETEATCTSSGLNKEVCKNCGDSRLVQTAPLGHDYQDKWIVEATCTTAGVRMRVCTRCGEMTDKENVAALGHDYEEAWTVDKAPTCTAAGTKSHHCTRCGKASDVTTVPKNGHDYDIQVKPATTKKDGLKTYHCKVCEKTVTKVIYKIDSIKLSKKTYTCDNTAKKPTVTVKNTADKKLTLKTDYKVTYEKGRKKPGTYTVTVTFIGDYKGTKTLKFTIQLGKTTGVTLKKAGGGKVKVSYDKVKGAQKYCIYVATSKNGEYEKLTNCTKTAYTTKALKSGKTYYFKVRATAKNTEGKNAFGAYSAISKIKL